MSLEHPEFDLFKRAFKEERYTDALKSIKLLISKFPQSFALRWHYVKVLERLERLPETRQALRKVLSMRGDFVPALILQVQLDFYNQDEADEDLPEEEQEEQQQARFEDLEQRLYKILSLDPKAVDALHLLSGLLRGHQGDAHLDKANQLLNRAIALAPQRVDLLEDRANTFIASAMLYEDDTTTEQADIVTTYHGARYSRPILELALADFKHCYDLSNQHRYGLRVASILHDLGRFDEALVAYDQVLSKVAEDDPHRPFIVERRARSLNNGGGEREQMAQMLEAAIGKGGKDRNLEEDNVANAILSAANAIRSGKSVGEALESRISDDPFDNVVTSIAVQILNVANEPHPHLVPANPKDFPAYQREFIEQCKGDLTPLGLHHVCDAEAEGLRLMLGKRVLLSFFADATGETGVACFSLKPKSPTLLGLLILFFTGKWKLLASLRKVTSMVECVSQYSNGDHLSTQYESVSPFTYGQPIYIKKLPRTASTADLVALHLSRVEEQREQYPRVKPLKALDLAGMEERWVKGQDVKRAYRAGIGYITEPELKQLLGANYAKFGDKVRAKVALLAADL